MLYCRIGAPNSQSQLFRRPPAIHTVVTPRASDSNQDPLHLAGLERALAWLSVRMPDMRTLRFREFVDRQLVGVALHSIMPADLSSFQDSNTQPTASVAAAGAVHLQRAHCFRMRISQPCQLAESASEGQHQSQTDCQTDIAASHQLAESTPPHTSLSPIDRHAYTQSTRPAPYQLTALSAKGS